MSLESSVRKSRILVADDDQSIRQLLCTIVKRERFEVDCVPDGYEAIEMLKKHDYAVVLLDLMMPRVDGFGVVEFLRENPPEMKPIVLIITAYADQKFKQVDPSIVAGVLRKPFEVSELGNLIRLCVQGYENATKNLALTPDEPTVRMRADEVEPLGNDSKPN